MSVVPKPSPAAFDLKSTSLSLIAVVLRTADADELGQALRARFADAPELFDGDPVIVDLSALRDADATIDFPALVEQLRRYRMLPVAARGGSLQQMADAHAASLSEAPDGRGARVQSPPVLQEVVSVEPPPPAAPPPRTLLVDKPLRSGQQVYARDADVAVMAVVNFGAEVIADGNVHVYAPLRGRAVAGARGDAGARILTTCFEPQLVSIAGFYRTADNRWPEEVAGKPAQVRLDGEHLVIEPLEH